MSDDLGIIEVANRQLRAKVKQYEDYLKAESLGLMASQNGDNVEENPYTEDTNTEERGLWFAGWNAADTHRLALRANACMTWAIGSLESIAEIARGNSQEEIDAKLQLVVAKFKEYVK